MKTLSEIKLNTKRICHEQFSNQIWLLQQFCSQYVTPKILCKELSYLYASIGIFEFMYVIL